MRKRFQWAFLFIYSVLSCLGVDGKRTLVWMCLEICGGNNASIQSDIKSIFAHQNSLTTISFEKYTLGPAATFVDFSSEFNLSDVRSLLPTSLEKIPMISSYPHLEQFVHYMRQLFANPFQFINAAVAEALMYDYDGYDVDFEPTTSTTAEDAASYAEFLNKFAIEMHKYGLILTVDVATWNNIWNFPLISSTSVDRVHTMSTYQKSYPLFQQHFAEAVSQIQLSKLGIGFEVYADFDDADWKQRFQMVQSSNITEIDIWDMPLPDNLWNFVENFMLT